MRHIPFSKVLPRRASYSIANQDLYGVEIDVKFKGQQNYSRLFFVPDAGKLYMWRCDRQPERFVRIPISSLHEKRKAALLEVWQGQPTEEVLAAP